MKKFIALFLAIIFACSIVVAASSRLFIHSIIYDEEVEEGTFNEFYVTTEWQWEDETEDDINDDNTDCECYEEPADDYEEIPLYENQIDQDDLQVTVFVPELGAVAMSLPYDQDDNERVSNKVMLDLEDAEPGEYVARVTVSNDYEERVKHRIFVIE